MAPSKRSPHEEKQEKKVLVLDLDEILVHSRHETFGEESDLTFTLIEDGCDYYVKLRPGARSFLDSVAKLFEVMIFTASDKEYADKVLDFLDPGGILISQRLYYDKGEFLDDGYVKDLSVLGHDLSKVAIVDNCPRNFRLQKENGIPITSWYVDPSDGELASLLPFLERLVDVDDVRLMIAEKFGFYKGKKKDTGNAAAETLVKPMENLSLAKVPGTILNLGSYSQEYM